MHSTLLFNMKPQWLNYFIGNKDIQYSCVDFAVCKYKWNLLIIVVIKFLLWIYLYQQSELGAEDMLQNEVSYQI